MATFFVRAGYAIITNRIIGAGTEPRYIGWGTGAGAPALTSTDVSTAASEARTNGTSTRQTTTQTNDTYRTVGAITADGTKTITNVGTFDAAGTGSPPTGGNLCVHGDFTGVPVVLNDQITFTINLQFRDQTGS